MDFSSDEFFGTLGGSLMRDLLADLQVDDNDFSLEQLEQELAQLDHEPPHLQNQPLPPVNAASMVVSHAQGMAGGVSAPPGVAGAPAATQDAWSLSLEKFTALSLQEDFLAADSVRKQQQQQNNLVSPPSKSMALDGAEDYDIGEKPSVAPPPGLGGLGGLLGAQPASSTAPTTSTTPVEAQQPKIQQQASGGVPGGEVRSVGGDVSQKSAPTVPGANQPATDQSNAQQRGAVPTQHPPEVKNVMPPPQTMAPRQENAANFGQPQPHAPLQATPIHGVVPPMPQHPMPGHPPPPFRAVQMVPPSAPQGVVVAAAMPSMGPAWQTPRPPPPPPAMRGFCNPHPSAPPVPASVLESKFMTARDIAYVIHSILKPVLVAGVSDDDYYSQFLRRMGGPQASGANPKNPKDINEEMASRASKSKEWSSENAVLGHVAKTNVTRPRALIATPLAPSEQDTEQKSRASLWKARVYCDQAYQAYQMVVEIWRSAPPGGVPPQVQLHLVKLMKCMGISLVEKEYRIDGESLKLIVKLSKGRTLIARVLEQALLPPNAVQALLPNLIDVLLTTSNKKGDEPTSDDIATERLFRSIAGVLQKLVIRSNILLQCLQVVLKNGKTSLSSAARMECVHTLLRKGGIAASHDSSEEMKAEWGKTESEFMVLIQSM